MGKDVQLGNFNGSKFNKGATLSKQILWYFVNCIFLRSPLITFIKFKIYLLKLFGARIGHGIYLKPGVLIKSPWNLVIGNNCWIGENVWIDNLDFVTIGNNVCISQGAMLLTGNHDYTDSSMSFRNAPIILEDGTWVGAKAVVCPGVTMHKNSILTVGSVATVDLIEDSIYQGNPAKKIRDRIILK